MVSSLAPLCIVLTLVPSKTGRLQSLGVWVTWHGDVTVWPSLNKCAPGRRSDGVFKGARCSTGQLGHWLSDADQIHTVRKVSSAMVLASPGFRGPPPVRWAQPLVDARPRELSAVHAAKFSGLSMPISDRLCAPLAFDRGN